MRHSAHPTLAHQLSLTRVQLLLARLSLPLSLLCLCLCPPPALCSSAASAPSSSPSASTPSPPFDFGENCFGVSAVSDGRCCWAPFSAFNYDVEDERVGLIECPAHCLHHTSLTPPLLPFPAAVFGSWPYHNSSSMCLAAIHSGLITDAEGGFLHGLRFRRHSWAGDATQTTFPFHSSRGSLSNGVQSLDVPASWHSVPAGDADWSATLHPKVGVFIKQRRSAPFPPRAGHLHAAVFVNDGTPTSVFAPNSFPEAFEVDLIVGGHNASHYLNDVWLAVRDNQHGTSPAVAHDFPRDWSFTRLPDAPFSGRANMLLSINESDYRFRVDGVFRLYFIGGQTGHSCGLRELGQCSNEVWVAELRRARNDTREMQLTWLAQPDTVPHLPFAPRCGATWLQWDAISHLPLPSEPVPIPSRQLKALAAGQLSVSASSSPIDCSTVPPSTNDVWYSVGAPDDAASWYRGQPAPFAPRRSARRDDGLLHIASVEHDSSAQEPFYSYILPAVSLVGGMRVEGVTAVGERGQQARLTAATMYADVWECVLPPSSSPLMGNVSECDWRGLRSDEAELESETGGEGEAEQPRWPADSVPLATADGAAPLRAVGGIGATRLGGRASQRSIAAWLSTLPLPAQNDDPTYTADVSLIPLNVSVIISRYDAQAAQSLADVMDARYSLDLEWPLSESELNDPYSSWNVGSDWVQAHWWVDQFWKPAGPTVTSAHLQPWFQADTPGDATPYLPQAASSLNTTRPLLQFRLARIGHGQSLNSYWTRWGTSVISGGRRGEAEYTSDWITMGQARCAPPDVPAYRASLGPVLLLSMYEAAGGFSGRDDMQQSSIARLRCPNGTHWEPPTSDEDLQLFCAPNGMWMGDALTIPRCVPHRLTCPPPTSDRGYERCVSPLPLITSIDKPDALRPRLDALTVVGLRPQQKTELIIRGENFQQPLVVLVGGRRCEFPQLWMTHPNGSAQAACPDAQGPLCPTFGSEVRCVMTDGLGVRMAVTLLSGPRAQLAGTLTGQVATVSTIPPVILWINASACTQPLESSALSLVDCPNDRPFNVTVALIAESLMQVPLRTPKWLRARLGQVELEPGQWSQSFAGQWSQSFTISFSEVSMQFEVRPRLGVELPLRVSQLDSEVESEEDALLSFLSCPPGTRNNDGASASNDTTDAPVCLPCQAGYSTANASGVSNCSPCLPGFFAPEPGCATCEPCPVDHYALEPGSLACLPCPPNSFSRLSGQLQCTTCQSNSYIHSGDASNEPTCVACPDSAVCAVDGNVTVQSGAFLIVGADGETLSSLDCSLSACQSALTDDVLSRPQCRSVQPRVLAVTRLSVVNCCGVGRLPAYDPTSPLLASSRGVNVLCAECQPGHSEVNGRCIPCSAVQWGWLTLMLLLTLLLVYSLHRLPHDWSGSARLNILTYSVQLTLLFLSSSALPSILTLLLLDMTGDHVTQRGRGGEGEEYGEEQVAELYVGVCVLPLSTLGRVVLRLLSPLIAVGCVALIACIQLALHQAVSHWPNQRATRLYHRLFPQLLEKEMPEVGEEEEGGASTAGSQASQASQPPMELDERAGGKVQDEEKARHEEGVGAPSLRGGWVVSVGWCGWWPSYQRTLVRVALSGHLTVSVTALSFLRMMDLGEFGRRPLDFPALDAQSDAYFALLPAVYLALVLYVLGLPLAIASLAWRDWRSRRTPAQQREMKEVEGDQRAGQGSFQQLSSALLVPGEGAASEGVVEADDASISVVEARLRRQLLSMYRPHLRMYAAFHLLRRLLLLTILVCVRGGSTWSWLTLANFLLLALHQRLQPYVRAVDNEHETWAVLTLSITTGLLAVYPPPTINLPLLAALTLLVLTPALAYVGARASTTYRRWRDTRKRRALLAESNTLRDSLMPIDVLDQRYG